MYVSKTRRKSRIAHKFVRHATAIDSLGLRLCTRETRYRSTDITLQMKRECWQHYKQSATLSLPAPASLCDRIAHGVSIGGQIVSESKFKDEYDYDGWTQAFSSSSRSYVDAWRCLTICSDDDFEFYRNSLAKQFYFSLSFSCLVEPTPLGMPGNRRHIKLFTLS